MKKTVKVIVSLMLAVTTLVAAVLPAFAAGVEQYICELRLVYADSYSEACNIIKDSDFHDYKVYKENLNEDSGKIGVYLAYKTTTDIEDAITDVSVMQMNGGYNEGSYQEMLRRSEEEYFAMSQTYIEAIDYWKKAYERGNFVAGAVLRQLNFYTVKDENSPYNGKLLGNIMLDGIDQYELATIFLQGNSYALDNIRSLLAMGVSYNEDGVHYLKKVEGCASTLQSDMSWYEDRLTEVNELIDLIIPTIFTIGKMFNELSAYESELDYTDENMTDLELQYVEHVSLAERMREINYLDGKTLYDFCVEYESTRSKLEADGDYDADDEDYTKFYPFVKALNEGQIAMTKVLHFYDVVRYSMTDMSEEVFNTKLNEMEKKYKENPFNIYAGVDRSIYEEDFAMTSAAYREDAYTKEGFLSYWVHEETAFFASGLATAGVGTGLLVWAILRTKAYLADTAAVKLAVDAANLYAGDVASSLTSLLSQESAQILGSSATQYGETCMDVLNALVLKAHPGFTDATLSTLSVDQKMYFITEQPGVLPGGDASIVKELSTEYTSIQNAHMKTVQDSLADAKAMTVSYSSLGAKIFTGTLYVLGGAMLIYSAVSLGISIYNYYNPEYDAVPVAMVDLVDTVDGDRYIKYDVVFEAEARAGGDYAPGDTNAYTGHRWNALYYTKSYEAGYPLLANFECTSRNNTPEEGFMPIHRFGEVICYDLNKYHMSSADAVYISIERSENHKSAVTDVPEVIGSMFSVGWALLAVGIGALAGIGATLGTQSALKKKKKGDNN